MIDFKKFNNIISLTSYFTSDEVCKQASKAAWMGEDPLPEHPSEPAWRIEDYLAAILSAAKGDDPVMDCPDPVWRVEEYGRAIYDAIVDASPAWPCPLPTNNIEAILYAIYKVVADDIEEDTPVPSWNTEHWLLDILDAAKEGGGTKETVTGTAPINLAAALAKPLISLTQYGLCTQEAGASLTTPKDILCNNGALRMVDDELPAGYRRVLGFSCNNNALWEITGFKLSGSDTVRISFSIDAACNVFGCYQGADATDNYDLYVSTTPGSKYFRYGGGTYASYWSSADLGQRFDVVYTPTGSQGMPQDSTWTALTFTSENDLLIGSTTLTGSSAKLKGNLYGSIVVDGRLKLIPCERVSDNVLGYYDTYSKTFFAPYAGYDGAISLGYDGSHYHLEVVGTDEVITLKPGSEYNLTSADMELGSYNTSNGNKQNATDRHRTSQKYVVRPGSRVDVKVSASDGNEHTVTIYRYRKDGSYIGYSYGQYRDVDDDCELVSVVVLGFTSLSDLVSLTIRSMVPEAPAGKNLYYPARRVDGRYINSAGNATNDVTCSYSDAIPVEYGKTYTASGIAGKAGTNKKRLIMFTDSTPSTSSKIGTAVEEPVTDIGTSYSVSITIDNANAKYIRFSFNTADTDVMIEEGSVASAYEPFIGEDWQFASVVDLLGIGEDRDVQEIVGGDTGRVIGVYVFDGTEAIRASSSSVGSGLCIDYFATTIGADKDKAVMCTHFDGRPPADGAMEEGTCFFYGANLYFRTTESVADFKADLAAKRAAGSPVMLVFVRKSETTEQAAPQGLMLSDGNISIDVTAEVSPITLEAVYKKARH